MARGAVWMVLLNLVERSLGTVSILILVRVLSPADFGLVAMATAALGLTQMFVAFGFDAAIIHRQDATDEHFHTAWTLNCFLAVAVSAILVIGARPVANYYGQAGLATIVYVIAAIPLISAAENIGVVAFRKSLDFRRDFTFQICKKIASFGVTLPMALILRSYWALVFGMIAGRLAGTVVSYIVHPFRPRFSTKHAATLFSFSKWLLFNNFINVLNDRFADLTLGRWAGPASLGVFNIASEFAYLPRTEIGMPINRALYSGFAFLPDTESIRNVYCRSTEMLAIVALPAAAGLSAIAPYFVPVVLGAKWIAAVPIMQLLSISGGVVMFQGAIATLLTARGFPSAVVFINLLYLVFLGTGAFFLMPRYGAIGTALSLLLAAILVLPVYLAALRRTIGIRTADFFRSTVRSAVAAGAMYVLVRLAVDSRPIVATDAKVVSLLIMFAVIAFGVVFFYSFLFLIWHLAGRPRGGESTLITIALNRISRFFSRSA